MKEKKLTDEEIVKALECCTVGGKCNECPYHIKKIYCVPNQKSEKDCLDLIRRLQYGYSSASKASEEWRAKYEAERKENAELQKQVDELKKRLHWIWAIGVDYDGLDKAESLKGLIDEMVNLTQIESKDLDEYFTYNTTQGGKMNILSIVRKQAVKDTAKEILDEVSKHYGGAWLVELYKRYGVEVE